MRQGYEARECQIEPFQLDLKRFLCFVQEEPLNPRAVARFPLHCARAAFWIEMVESIPSTKAGSSHSAEQRTLTMLQSRPG